PQRLAVLAPEARQRPAWKLLTRVPLALPVVEQPLRRVTLLQPSQQLFGELALARAKGLRIPLRAVAIVDRHERRLAAHGEPHVVRPQLGVEAQAEGVNRAPLRLAVWLGDARGLAHPLDAHLVRKLDLALLGQPRHRGCARRLRRAGERNVALAGEESGSRI